MTNSTQATGSAHKQQQQQQPTSIRRRRRRRYTDQDTATATPSKPTLNQRIMSRRNIGSSNASEINNTNNQQTPPKSAHSDRAYQSSRKTKSTTNSNNSHGSMSSKSPIKEELPIFTEKPELKTFADEHSHIRLPCRVDKPQWDFRWSRDSYPIFSINGTDRTLVPDRFKYVGSPESGDCSIEIHDLQPQDGGLFQCRLISWLGDELDKKTVETKLTFQTTLVVVPAKAHSQQTSTASSDNNNNSNNNQDSTSILTQRDIPANGKQKVSHSSDHSTQQQQFSSSTQENWLPPSVQGNNMNNGPDVQATMLPNTNTHLTSFATNSNSSSSSIMNLTLAAVNWPYVLTALACLLMLVNVYLVVSLIKRSRCVTARSSNRSSSPSTGSNLSTSAITKQRKQQQQQLQQKPTTPASDYDTIKSKSLAAQVAVAAAERVAAAASSREHLQQQHQHLLQQQQQQQLQQQATTATTTTTLSSSSLSASDEQQSPQYLDLYLSTNNLAPNGINLGSDNYYSPHTIVTNLGPLQYADTSVALGWPATLI